MKEVYANLIPKGTEKKLRRYNTSATFQRKLIILYKSDPNYEKKKELFCGEIGFEELLVESTMGNLPNSYNESIIYKLSTRMEVFKNNDIHDMKSENAESKFVEVSITSSNSDYVIVPLVDILSRLGVVCNIVSTCVRTRILPPPQDYRSIMKKSKEYIMRNYEKLTYEDSKLDESLSAEANNVAYNIMNKKQKKSREIDEFFYDLVYEICQKIIDFILTIINVVSKWITSKLWTQSTQN